MRMYIPPRRNEGVDQSLGLYFQFVDFLKKISFGNHVRVIVTTVTPADMAEVNKRIDALNY